MKRTRELGIVLAGVLAAAACSPGEILDVENPDIIDPLDVTSPAGLAALHAGALGDFSLAIVGDNGGTEGQILVSGSFTDELSNVETFPTRKEFDQRGPIDLKNGTLLGVFRNLHRARRSAERAAEVIKTVSTTPATDARIGEAFNLAGFLYLSMAENYCSGVPVSTADESGGLTFGDPLTTTELLNRAISRFDSALAYPANATVTNTAKIGKARAQLDLNNPSGAAATVAGVPTTFSYNTTHTVSLGRQQNGVFVFMNQSERFGVANLDGGNGLNFRGAQDPRVPWARVPANNVGFDNATPDYYEGKYASETAPIAIANGVEARLIEAEASLRAGDNTTWLATLNTLRATASLVPSVFPANFPSAATMAANFPALTPLADPGSVATREDLMFRERAFWLYLSGHRLGDLRRLVRQYGRSANAVYPGGGGAQYVIDGNPKGGVFGNEVNLPVPFDETNNPQFTQCIDRNP
ncbi:MAG TPA: RagB/SusD family nutrient uptake outer membrane protein [Gemmatimonadales bacterium]|nr:RagB/SusD family nutrient uptake outer membrane protein [Gemmatimonadales bacterium]